MPQPDVQEGVPQDQADQHQGGGRREPGAQGPPGALRRSRAGYYWRAIREDQVIGEIMLKPMPKGVFIGIDELAGITAFLVSPAARNITGQAIVVDGGWTSQ